jgi:RNA polymerase sigma-70 factor (ECF subfamily)
VPDPKRGIPPLSDDRSVAPTQAALALELVTPMDLLRLKSIARLHARGLPPDITWDDLLQEAITRVLTGRRAKPGDVPMVAFLAGIMRSLRADHIRRRLRRGERDDTDTVRTELVDPAVDLERALIAIEELANLRALFAADPLALTIIGGLADGLEPEQIRARFDITRTDYDSARKRMRRCLLREGLTCGKT